jgi:glycopeptide antibiotics resistance protein
MSCFIVFFILFNTLGVEQFRFYQTVSLYHIVYALICLFTVFATATVIAEKNENTSYAEFYNDFFLGYLFVMIMLYYLFYYEYRTSSDDFIINLIPFHGEIKTVFKDFTSQTVMRTLGNIAYYSTVALTVSRFIKKHTALSGFLVAFLLCVITELVQGIFKTGDADIDDIILNGVGALIGALIYKFVIEKLRRKEICSE